jgi:hypothetical protein
MVKVRGRLGPFWGCSQYRRTGCNQKAAVREWRLILTGSSTLWPGEPAAMVAPPVATAGVRAASPRRVGAA